MANTKISALTANTNPTGNEELVYAYNNANGKMTLDTMKTFAVSGKQDTLVSGTNIKTINNTSLLGSGNISISGASNIFPVEDMDDTSGLQAVLNSFLGGGSPVIRLQSGNTYPAWFYVTGASNGKVFFWSVQEGATTLNLRLITINYSGTTVSSAAITQHNVQFS